MSHVARCALPPERVLLRVSRDAWQANGKRQSRPLAHCTSLLAPEFSNPLDLFLHSPAATASPPSRRDAAPQPSRRLGPGVARIQARTFDGALSTSLPRSATLNSKLTPPASGSSRYAWFVSTGSVTISSEGIPSIADSPGNLDCTTSFGVYSGSKTLWLVAPPHVGAQNQRRGATAHGIWSPSSAQGSAPGAAGPHPIGRAVHWTGSPVGAPLTREADQGFP